MKWYEWFYYDESSPSCLRWNVERRKGKGIGHLVSSVGTVAGHVNAGRYYYVHLGRSAFTCHRVIYEMQFGNIGKFEIDHIDGDCQNNKISNLRKVTKAINGRNTKLNSKNTYGYCGVRFRHNGGDLETSGNWVVNYTDLYGKQKCKSFSSKKYGYDVAKTLAIEYRRKMIDDLNKQGAGYTDTHGVR